MDQLIGKVVDGYQILKVLGRGGMGSVYKAKDQNLDKLVAIKMLEPRLVENPNFLKRFLEEPKLQAKLDSPYIVRVNAFRKTEAGLFMVMEFVDGKDLSDHIRKNGPYTWRQALPIFVKLLKAFDHAHSVGIIHRDIKPHNVLINERGDVKVTDFGLAKYQDTGDLTKTQTVAGTVKYMPPEQVRGLTNVDHRGDIYALGITLYEMLTGTTPFRKRGGADYELLRAIVEDPAPPPTDINPNIPKQLSDIIMKSIAKNREQRYQTANEMLVALHQFVKGLQPGAAAASLGDPIADDPTFAGEDLTSATATNLQQPSIARGATVDQTQSVATQGTQNTDGIGGLASQYTQDRTPESVYQSPSMMPKILGGIGGVAILTIAAYFLLPFGESAASGTSPAIAENIAAYQINSVPDGAGVYLDGQLIGQTPFQGDTTIAAYDLSLRKAGYEEYKQRITLDEEGSNAFESQLVPIREAAGSNTQPRNTNSSETRPVTPDRVQQKTFTIRARAIPSGKVSVNGLDESRVAGGNTASLVVPVGSHQVVFSHPVYGTFRKTISGTAGQAKNITCFFEQEIAIQSLGPDGEPLTGRIFLNGKNARINTPNTLKLGPGKHEIDVLHHSFNTENGAMTITLDPFRKYGKGLVFKFL